MKKLLSLLLTITILVVMGAQALSVFHDVPAFFDYRDDEYLDISIFLEEAAPVSTVAELRITAPSAITSSQATSKPSCALAQTNGPAVAVGTGSLKPNLMAAGSQKVCFDTGIPKVPPKRTAKPSKLDQTTKPTTSSADAEMRSVLRLPSAHQFALSSKRSSSILRTS